MVRHCVSIDERRAKFRQDLIYQGAQQQTKRDGHSHRSKHLHDFVHDRYRARRSAIAAPSPAAKEASRGRRDTLVPEDSEHAFRPHSRSRSRATNRHSSRDGNSFEDRRSVASGLVRDTGAESDAESDSDEQDIDEIW